MTGIIEDTDRLILVILFENISQVIPICIVCENEKNV